MNIDWNNLVRQHAHAVYGAAWRVLGHAADSEDVVQEVFLEAQQLQRPQKVANWAGFLKQLATFRALDRLRKRKPEVCLKASHVADQRGPEAAAMDGELRTDLRNALATLPEQQSATFCLRYFEELTNQQIGEALNISESAVSTSLNKARVSLRQILEQREGA